ncbi:MAG: hypothetical protein GW859_08830 [Sphingomonadales bacterium]|nr:hypothetical protein [Sphingomonadales bacterium]
MEAFFLSFVEGTIQWIDERYGRIAAWIAAIGMIMAIFVAFAGLIWWLFR